MLWDIPSRRERVNGRGLSNLLPVECELECGTQRSWVFRLEYVWKEAPWNKTPISNGALSVTLTALATRLEEGLYRYIKLVGE